METSESEPRDTGAEMRDAIKGRRRAVTERQLDDLRQVSEAIRHYLESYEGNDLAVAHLQALITGYAADIASRQQKAGALGLIRAALDDE